MTSEDMYFLISMVALVTNGVTSQLPQAEEYSHFKHLIERI